MLRPEKQADAATFYNEAEASRYSSCGRVRELEAAFANRIVQLMGLGKSERIVLDVGCGSGLSMLELHAQGFTVLGCDVSAAMLHIASLAFSASASPKCPTGTNGGSSSTCSGKLALCDMSQGLPYRPCSVDAVVGISSVEWLTYAPGLHSTAGASDSVIAAVQRSGFQGDAVEGKNALEGMTVVCSETGKETSSGECAAGISHRDTQVEEEGKAGSEEDAGLIGTTRVENNVIEEEMTGSHRMSRVQGKNGLSEEHTSLQARTGVLEEEEEANKKGMRGSSETSSLISACIDAATSSEEPPENTTPSERMTPYRAESGVCKLEDSAKKSASRGQLNAADAGSGQSQEETDDIMHVPEVSSRGAYETTDEQGKSKLGFSMPAEGRQQGGEEPDTEPACVASPSEGRKEGRCCLDLYAPGAAQQHVDTGKGGTEEVQCKQLLGAAVMHSAMQVLGASGERYSATDNAHRVLMKDTAAEVQLQQLQQLQHLQQACGVGQRRSRTGKKRRLEIPDGTKDADSLDGQPATTGTSIYPAVNKGQEVALSRFFRAVWRVLRPHGKAGFEFFVEDAHRCYMLQRAAVLAGFFSSQLVVDFPHKKEHAKRYFLLLYKGGEDQPSGLLTNVLPRVWNSNCNVAVELLGLVGQRNTQSRGLTSSIPSYGCQEVAIDTLPECPCKSALPVGNKDIAAETNAMNATDAPDCTDMTNMVEPGNLQDSPHPRRCLNGILCGKGEENLRTAYSLATPYPMCGTAGEATVSCSTLETEQASEFAPSEVTETAQERIFEKHELVVLEDTVGVEEACNSCTMTEHLPLTTVAWPLLGASALAVRVEQGVDVSAPEHPQDAALVSHLRRHVTAAFRSSIRALLHHMPHLLPLDLRHWPGSEGVLVGHASEWSHPAVCQLRMEQPHVSESLLTEFMCHKGLATAGVPGGEFLPRSDPVALLQHFVESLFGYHGDGRDVADPESGTAAVAPSVQQLTKGSYNARYAKQQSSCEETMGPNVWLGEKSIVDERGTVDSRSTTAQDGNFLSVDRVAEIVGLSLEVFVGCVYGMKSPATLIVTLCGCLGAVYEGSWKVIQKFCSERLALLYLVVAIGEDAKMRICLGLQSCRYVGINIDEQVQQLSQIGAYCARRIEHSGELDGEIQQTVCI